MAASALLAKLMEKVMTKSLTFFWTSVMSVKLLKHWVLKGRGGFQIKDRPIPPKILTNDEWNHNYVKLSEVKLHYVHAGDSSKPLVLFLHGFPEFWYTWRHQIRDLKRDYYVVAVDMRGYGDSAKPPGRERYTIQKLGIDIMEVVLKLGYESCHLIGHDWGAAVAWHVAELHPKVVQNLIILNVPHPAAFQSHLQNGAFSQILKSWYMFFFQFPALPELWIGMNDLDQLETYLRKPPSGPKRKDAFTDEDIEAWKYTFGQPNALTYPINYYRNIFDNQTPPSGQKIKQPVLIIWGTEDIYLEEKMAHLSLDFCENANLKLIEGASHWVQNDEPELCNEYIRHFLIANSD